MAEVLWTPSALDRLATIWTESSRREAVNEAVARIDRELAADPAHSGESRDEGRRILIDLPLGVIFRPGPGGASVTVLAVWAIRPRNP